MGREDKILGILFRSHHKLVWTNPAASPLGALQMSKAKAAASAKKGSSKVDASSSEGFPILKYSGGRPGAHSFDVAKLLLSCLLPLLLAAFPFLLRSILLLG